MREASFCSIRELTEPQICNVQYMRNFGVLIPRHLFIKPFTSRIRDAGRKEARNIVRYRGHKEPLSKQCMTSRYNSIHKFAVTVATTVPAYVKAIQSPSTKRKKMRHHPPIIKKLFVINTEW